MRTWLSAVLLGAALFTSGCGASDADPVGSSSDELTPSTLPQLGLDPAGTTVSGLSSGAFMAVQMQVAHASTIHGVAVFAGGPYLCSAGSVLRATTTCMAPPDPASVPTAESVADVKTGASLGLVDPASALQNTRVFLYGGADDVVVHPAVMSATSAFFRGLVDASGIEEHLQVPGTGHVFPTVAKGGACKDPDATFIGACGVDGAGLALSHLYGELAPRSSAPDGTLRQFSQRDYAPYGLAAAGLGAGGYVYVPRSCAAGDGCRLHVVFHGCEQHASGSVGTRFVTDTGFLEWADHNRLVVLFPQVAPSPANPKACWDFWGYTGPAFATRWGLQISAVEAMISRLISARSKHS